MKFNPKFLLTLTAIIAFNLAGCQNPDTEMVAARLQARLPIKGSSCPCPYDIAPDGTECKDKSAYSKSGGKEPQQCYQNTYIPRSVINTNKK